MTAVLGMMWMSLPDLAEDDLMSGADKRWSAWVVRWDWVGEHAAVEQEVAGILPASWGAENVMRVVEALYAAREYTPAEMLEAARRNGHKPSRASLGTGTVILEDGTRGSVNWLGEIVCGHNPYLIARQARVGLDPSKPGQVLFEDSPRPQLDLRDQPFGPNPAAPVVPPS
jgi:hypothetical protein